MRHLALLFSLILAALAPSVALAQQDAVAAAEGATQPPLDAGALEQLVAPIALYPDPLLAEVLMASTYPLEIVQADRFAKANKDLKGEKLDQALAGQDWDESIKALVATPSVLAMMSEQLDWTEKLGDAVLAQQAEIMDAIQSLRTKAQANGKLETTEQQKVEAKQEAGKQVIVIEPAAPETIYVPYYDPAVVYGTWAYPTYEPYYFPPPPGWGYGGAIARGIAWGAGFAIADAIWDNDFDWRRGDIRVNRNVNINNINRGDVNIANWQHNPKHRRGVNYSNAEVKNKFAKADVRPADRKLDFRGHDGKPILKPGGGDRPQIGGNLPKPGGGGPEIGNLPKPPGGKDRPDIGEIKEGLKDKRPGAQAALQDRKADLGKGKPDLSKVKPKAKPAGNAFDTRDGAKAKDFAKRGQASLGDRGAKQFSKPQARPKAAAVRKPARPAHVGGGRPGGGRAGGGRGGGRRR